MKFFKKIIPVFLCIAILVLSIPAVDAVDYVSKAGFWTWVAGKNEFIQSVIGGNWFSAATGVCPSSEDGRHHATSPYAELKDGYFECICDSCGDHFKAYASDLSDAYTTYVQNLPFPGYSSGGRFFFPLTVSDLVGKEFKFSSISGVSAQSLSLTINSPVLDYSPYTFTLLENRIVHGTMYVSNPLSVHRLEFGYMSFVAPVSGFYGTVSGPAVVCSYTDSVNQVHDVSNSYFTSSFGAHYLAGDKITVSVPSSISLHVSAQHLVC